MPLGNLQPLGGPLFTVLMKVGGVAVKEGDALDTMAALVVSNDGDATEVVAAADIAAAAIGAVYVSGVFEAKAAAAVNFAVLDKVVVATNAGATYDAGTATNPVSGRVIDTDPASAGLFHMWLLGFFNEVRGTI